MTACPLIKFRELGKPKDVKPLGVLKLVKLSKVAYGTVSTKQTVRCKEVVRAKKGHAFFFTRARAPKVSCFVHVTTQSAKDIIAALKTILPKSTPDDVLSIIAEYSTLSKLRIPSETSATSDQKTNDKEKEKEKEKEETPPQISIRIVRCLLCVVTISSPTNLHSLTLESCGNCDIMFLNAERMVNMVTSVNCAAFCKGICRSLRFERCNECTGHVVDPHKRVVFLMLKAGKSSLNVYDSYKPNSKLLKRWRNFTPERKEGEGGEGDKDGDEVGDELEMEIGAEDPDWDGSECCTVVAWRRTRSSAEFYSKEFMPGDSLVPMIGD